MLFLGRAANYRAGDILRHIFAIGTKNSSNNLKIALADRYQSTPDQIALYHTGRTALSVGLKTLLPKNAEVLINGFTCHAVLAAVKSAHLTPVFADIDQKTLHYDAKILEKTLKTHPDLKAIIIQNTLGIPVDIAPIEKIAKKHHLLIIEDLAHCAGIRYPDGRLAGTVGELSALSFGKGKSIDTISGGALIFRTPTKPLEQPEIRPKLADSLRDRWYPFFGACMRGAYHLHLEKLVTGVLLKLRFIARSADAELDKTHRLTHWQAKLALKQLKNFQKSDQPLLRTPLFVKNREKLLKELKAAGFIFDEIWYDVPISPTRYYKSANFPEKSCPTSVKLAAEIINLPTNYPPEKLKPALKIIERYKND